jgi:hypothetical protein
MHPLTGTRLFIPHGHCPRHNGSQCLLLLLWHGAGETDWQFYRIPTSDRYQQGGTGLGLALIKKLASYLGGSIWAESGAGKTRFIVDLPITPPNDIVVK